MSKVIIRAEREGYSTRQITDTMTVGELKSLLEDYDEESKIYLSHDNGYTYGGLKTWKFSEEEEEEE